MMHSLSTSTLETFFQNYLINHCNIKRILTYNSYIFNENVSMLLEALFFHASACLNLRNSMNYQKEFYETKKSGVALTQLSLTLHYSKRIFY